MTFLTFGKGCLHSRNCKSIEWHYGTRLQRREKWFLRKLSTLVFKCIHRDKRLNEVWITHSIIKVLEKSRSLIDQHCT